MKHTLIHAQSVNFPTTWLIIIVLACIVVYQYNLIKMLAHKPAAEYKSTTAQEERAYNEWLAAQLKRKQGNKRENKVVNYFYNKMNKLFAA